MKQLEPIYTVTNDMYQDLFQKLFEISVILECLSEKIHRITFKNKCVTHKSGNSKLWQLVQFTAWRKN